MTADERLGKLEVENAALKQRLDAEKAERQALEKLVLPPLIELRKDVGLNIDYLTGRVEELKAGGQVPDDIYQCLAYLLQRDREAGECFAQLYRVVNTIGAKLLALLE